MDMFHHVLEDTLAQAAMDMFHHVLEDTLAQAAMDMFHHVLEQSVERICSYFGQNMLLLTWLSCFPTK